MKATWASIGRGMDTQNVYIYNEYLALKKEGNSTTCYTVNEA
jgi:hypothetical protein